MAVELDKKAVAYLQAKFAPEIKNGRLELIESDILTLNLDELGLKSFKYKIVANLPYNITSFFLRRYLEKEPKPEEMVLMLQKEVAERVVAKTGAMSILAVSVQYYADTKILAYVDKNKFWPAPKVDSAIIKIDLKDSLDKGSVDKEKDFFRLVKIGFSSRRKMLKNNLMSGYKISQEMAKDKIKSASLDEKIRAQDLSLLDWQNLFVQFSWFML